MANSNNDDDIPDSTLKIRAAVKGFSAKQAVFFANLCAIRVLPFLCDTVFSFWADEKPRHLSAIFNAIDVNLKYSYDLAASADDYVAAAYADAYAAAAYNDDAYVAYAAAATAYVAYTTDSNATSLTDDAADIITDIAAGAIDKQSSLKDVILGDINSISQDTFSSRDYVIQEEPDDAWNNFKNVLSGVDHYWADLCAILSAHGFFGDET